MSNRRQGKIARLPKQLRDAVCLALRDGADDRTVIKLIAAARKNGAMQADGRPVQIPNAVNVSKWVKGKPGAKSSGYKDWLHEQERLDDMQRRREFAVAIAKANEGSQVHQANLDLAASQALEFLNEFDITGLIDAAKEKPGLYVEVVRTIAPIADKALNYQKFKRMVEEVRAVVEEPKITPEEQRARLREILK